MTKRFQVVRQGDLLPVALRILAERKISELPVVDQDQRSIGLIDITDVMSMMKSYWPTTQGTTDVDHSHADTVEEAYILPLRRPNTT
jgi:CBS domain-containing protein